MPDVTPELPDAVAAFPTRRQVGHCGTRFDVSPFDLDAVCPACGHRLKVRAFAAAPEVEDVFDAVFAWMARPEHAEAARRRLAEVAADAG